MKTIIKSSIVSIGLVMSMASGLTAEVSIPNTFTAGDTASAAQVNENFTALKNAMGGIEWENISQTNVNFHDVTTIATVTLVAPTDGYVVVHFDGQAIPASGDRLVLAASDDESWHVNDGAISIFGDGHSHSFSHTRIYPVSAGSHDFHAVGQVYVDTAGNDIASVYATLTATFYPNRY